MMITKYGFAIGGTFALLHAARDLLRRIRPAPRPSVDDPGPDRGPDRELERELERALERALGQSRELLTLLGEAVRDLIEVNDTDHAEFRRRLDALEGRSGGRLDPENPINWRSPCDDDDSYP